MIIQVGATTGAGQYTHASDPAAGATGTFGMQIIIPAFSKIRRVVACTTQLFASTGGAATISFGLMQIGVTGPLTNGTAFFVANNQEFYNQQDALGNFIALASDRNFNSSPLKIYTAVEVVMLIGTTALTAGAIQLEVEYSEMSF